ncbi:MAG: GcrA cell cycle regulator [Hyphomicrobiaceae bacterium]|nr:GcrA cell cycle regulator [Hyphomicrobiaceae bacterium]
MAWNDERVELLKKLWSDGLSASQIAGRLGGVTRNAVIGKVHRLGLSGRATTSRMKSHRPRARAQSPRRLLKPRFSNIGNPALRQLYLGDTEPYTPVAEELVIPVGERRSIQTLTETSCRWPIGDPQMTDFHFCGRKKIAGLPYCDFHARRAFQPPQPRRRDREVLVPGMPGVVGAQLVPSISGGGEATVTEAEPKEKAAV